MPRRKRARAKRRRTWKDDWLVLPQPTLDQLIGDIEKPLSEAIGLTGALKLMGEGLSERGDEGCGVLAVSEAVFERLHAVQEAWLGIRLVSSDTERRS